MGRTMPSAASASMPTSAMRATYILSTILYKKVISCATTAGTDSRTMSGRIFPSASSAVMSPRWVRRPAVCPRFRGSCDSCNSRDSCNSCDSCGSCNSRDSSVLCIFRRSPEPLPLFRARHPAPPSRSAAHLPYCSTFPRVSQLPRGARARRDNLTFRREALRAAPAAMPAASRRIGF